MVTAFVAIAAPAWGDCVGIGCVESDPNITAAINADSIDLGAEKGGLPGADLGALEPNNVDPIDPGTARCYETTDAICVADRAAPVPLPGEPAGPTIRDLANFPVTVATAHNQPTGWGVVDKPTNFYADGGSHIVSGTLLNQPAQVRFTPVAWHWDYGDGTTASLDRPGTPWDKSTQFRPTPTTHTYTRKNDFTITLYIDYLAEYQYAGQPWRPIAGALRVRANDLQIITWRVKTVLVPFDCIDDPTGVGCPGTLRRDNLEY